MLMHKNVYPCGWARRIPLSHNPIIHINILRKGVLRNTPCDERGEERPRDRGKSGWCRSLGILPVATVENDRKLFNILDVPKILGQIQD